MEEKMISIEFGEEELTHLIEELMGIERLLTKVGEDQILDLHKDESPDVQEMFLNLHRSRVKFVQDMIDKLLPHDPFLIASMQ